MTPNEIAGQIVGVVQIILYIVSMQLSKRTHMLFAFSALNLSSFLNLFLIGAEISSFMGCIIATVHCLINGILSLKGHKSSLVENLLWCAVYIASWSFGMVITVRSGNFKLIELLPFVALIFYFGTVFFLKERNIRLCTMGNSVAFLIYNLCYMNVAAVAQILSIISTVIALIRYREKKQEYLPED